jgi:hypothetical protein
MIILDVCAIGMQLCGFRWLIPKSPTGICTVMEVSQYARKWRFQSPIVFHLYFMRILRRPHITGWVVYFSTKTKLMEPINRRATQSDILPAQEYNSTRYMCARNNALLKTLRACVIDVKANAQIPSGRVREKAEHKPKAWPQQARVAQ